MLFRSGRAAHVVRIDAEVVIVVLAVAVHEAGADMHVHGAVHLAPVAGREPCAQAVAFAAGILQQHAADDQAIARVGGIDPGDVAEDAEFDGAVEKYLRAADLSPGDAEANNRLNAQIRKAIVEEGHFYMVQTQLRGLTWLRVTLVNPQTDEEILEALLERVVKLSKE